MKFQVTVSILKEDLFRLLNTTHFIKKRVQENIFYVEKEIDGVGVEVALTYVDDVIDKITPFANNIYNPEGGTHVTGFNMVLSTPKQLLKEK